MATRATPGARGDFRRTNVTQWRPGSGGAPLQRKLRPPGRAFAKDILLAYGVTHKPRSGGDAGALRGAIFGLPHFQAGRRSRQSLLRGSSSSCWRLAIYHMPPLQSLEASLWGNLSMWSAFLVLYTGQIFGQAYRNTGLLEILLESIQSMLPSWDQEGRAVALVTLVGGFIGAFNGFRDVSRDHSRSGRSRLRRLSAPSRAISSIFPGRFRSTACSSRRIFRTRRATCPSSISCASRDC